MIITKSVITLSFIVFFRVWEAREKAKAYPVMMAKAWEEGGMRVRIRARSVE